MKQIEQYAGLELALAAKAHRQWAERALNRFGLHTGQELILLQLVQEEGQTQSCLAERLEVEPPAITRMLHRMEHSGLIERRQDAEDARITHVYLTEQGRGLEQAALDIWRQLEARTVAGLSETEQVQLCSLLKRVHANLT